jgi:PKHD-type hydroxylase
MQHLLTPYAVPMEPFVCREDVFSKDQLNWLQQQAKQATQTATVGNGMGGGVDTGIRRSQLHWLYKTPDSSWVYDILGEAVSALNAQYFGFDLTGFGEAFQLTHYDGTDNGMYGWHYDYGGDKISPSRKLSLVVQLSDPSEYEGGELQIMYSSTPASVQKQRGLVAAFPAYMLHQVTPVTSGTRQTLVAWVSGPPFR